MRRFVASLVLVILGTYEVLAAPVVMQNDSVTDFSQVAIQTGFAADEKAAAWLTATCPGDLTAVQIYWQSLTGGGGDTLAQSLEIFLPGAFPVPGTRVLELLGPVLTDGFLNQFPIPQGITLALGETFVVSFQFLSGPTPGFGPSLATDIDGCQASKNGIFAIPPNIWFDACLLGVSGDLVIRAVVDCAASPPLFTDGFENGDTSAWDVAVP